MRDLPGALKRLNIQLTGPCNYDCHYCYVSREKRQANKFGRLSTPEGEKSLVRFLGRIGDCVVNVIGGGEFFLLPNFISLCRAITRNNELEIITNLSIPVDDFLRQVPSNKVCGFIVSLHPEAEKNFFSFMTRLLKLKKSGINISIIYVAHPLRIKNLKKLASLFREQSILFRVAPFSGQYKNRNYPMSYSEKEMEEIKKYIIDPSAYRRLTKGPRLHYSKLCNTGFTTFEAYEDDGRVTRCDDSPVVIGNMYKGHLTSFNRPYPCDAAICGCGKNLDEEIFVHEYYRKLLSGRLRKPLGVRIMREYDKLCEPVRHYYRNILPQLKDLGVSI